LDFGGLTAVQDYLVWTLADMVSVELENRLVSLVVSNLTPFTAQVQPK